MIDAGPSQPAVTLLEDQAPPPNHSGAPRKPVWRRRWFLIAGGLLVFVGIGGALSSRGSDDPLASEGTETPASSAVEQQSTTTAEATTTREPSTTRSTTSTTVAVPTVWESFTISGSGDDVIEFAVPNNQPAVIAIEHSGSGNFAIVSYSSLGDRIDLLVNEIGSYKGRHGINFLTGEEVAELEITAGGPWSIVASPLLEADSMTSTYEGIGDDVILFAGSGNRLEVSHDGESNFAVISWGQNGRDLLVNEIGPYSGTVRMDDGTILITITADGVWTLATG